MVFEATVAEDYAGYEVQIDYPDPDATFTSWSVTGTIFDGVSCINDQNDDGDAVQVGAACSGNATGPGDVVELLFSFTGSTPTQGDFGILKAVAIRASDFTEVPIQLRLFEVIP
jgi:hypothetical protein